MKRTMKKIVSLCLTLVVAIGLVAMPFQASAFEHSSSKHLPFNGAEWKTWKQGDSRWGSITIGTGTSTTMSSAGCVLTSMAMGAKSYGARLTGTISDTVTPKTVVEKCKAVGTVTSTGDYYWSKTNLAFEDLTYYQKVTNLTTVTTMTNKVKEYLNSTNAEYMVVIYFSGSHYVVADYIDGSTLYVYDPAVGAVTTLSTALNRKSSYSLSAIHVFKYTGIHRGDVDRDGVITSTDARLVLQYAEGKIAAVDIWVNAADFDGDGKVTSSDAQIILQYAAGKV